MASVSDGSNGFKTVSTVSYGSNGFIVAPAREQLLAPQHVIRLNHCREDRETALAVEGGVEVSCVDAGHLTGGHVAGKLVV